MALIVCSECGKEFSDKAAACPQCGCPTEEVLKSIKKHPDTVTLDKEEQALKDNNRETLRDYLERARTLEIDCYTYRQIISNLRDSKFTIPFRERPSVSVNEGSIRQWYIDIMLEEGNREALRKCPPWYTELPEEDRCTIQNYFEEHPIPTLEEYQKFRLSGFWKESLEGKAFALKYHVIGIRKDYKEHVENLNKLNQTIRDRRRALDEKVKKTLDENTQILSDYNEYQKECGRSKALNEQIDHHITEMQNELNESEKALQRLYELNVIYPKYRSLIPVTMFCEYMDSGRRTVLEGVHGMYDLYESELLGKTIVDKLSVINSSLVYISSKLGQISSQLSGIQRNQIMVYEEVARGNDIANQIYRNTRTMADNSKLLSSQLSEVKTELHQINGDLGAKLEAIHNSSVKTAYNTEAQTRRIDAIAKIEEYEFALRQCPFFK